MKFITSSGRKVRVLYILVNHGNKNYLINLDQNTQKKFYSSKSIARQSQPIAELNQSESLNNKHEDTQSYYTKISTLLIPYMLSASEFISIKSITSLKSASFDLYEDFVKSTTQKQLSLKELKPEILKNTKTIVSDENTQTVVDDTKDASNKAQSKSKSVEAKLKEWSLSNKAIMEDKLLKLCDSIPKATSALIKTILINDLFKILYDNSELRYLIHRKRKQLFKDLLNIREDAIAQKNTNLAGNINEILALLGVSHPSKIKYRGINILSLDGGGSKGFVTIEILKQIEKDSGKPIHELFDYIIGVSTGAVLATLVGILKLPLTEVERLYSQCTEALFNRSMTTGIQNLLKSYSYYDTQMWESVLQNIIGDIKLINSAREINAPKISIVSNVTTANHMKVFLFRNYNLPPLAQSHYDGTARHKCWEAIRASSAAPGYYEDFKLDGYVFHDGGLLANNPTAIAIHEAKHIWPNMDTNCIVSIGNGRFKPAGYASSKAEYITLKQKIARVFSGIGDPEVVHTMLLDTMKPSTYFRFNPYMSEEFNLDEARPEKWKMMQFETKMYARRNDFKFKMLSKQLLKPQSNLKKFQNFIYELKKNCSILKR